MKNKKYTLNKILSFQIPEKIKGILIIFILFFIQTLLFVFNIEVTARGSSLDWGDFFYWLYFDKYSYITFLTIILLRLIVFFISGSLFSEYVVMEIATVVFGMVNRFVFLYRNEYVSLKDLELIDEAVKVEIDFLKEITLSFVMIIILGTLIGIITYKINKKTLDTVNKKNLPAVIARISCTVIIIAMILVQYRHYASADYFYVFHGFISPKKMGAMVYFLESMFWGNDDEVTYEMAEKIYDLYKAEAELSDWTYSNSTPNIIVIMSESFWDIDNIGGSVRLSENPIEKYKKIAGEGISGEIAVNVYGGGTAATELEFLTGLNIQAMAGDGNYKALYSNENESFVSYMHELGYYTMAFHPYYGNFWDRDLGYAGMGFDRFYDVSDFKYREYYRGYISDNSLSDEIIYRYEEQKKSEADRPVFCFAVSVQNHVRILSGADAGANDSYEEKIHVEFTDVQLGTDKEKEIVQYINGISETTASLEKLINYYKECCDDTVIVFFGDHAPDFAKDIYASDDEKYLYRTPYMIWANFDFEKKDYGDFNSSYLSSVLMDCFNLPHTNQYYMNTYLRNRYPVNTLYEITDVMGNNLQEMFNGSSGGILDEYINDMENEKKINAVTAWCMKNYSYCTNMWNVVE